MRMSFLRLAGLGRAAPRPHALAVAGLFMAGLTALSACSVADTLRPDVDLGTRTGALPARGLQALVPSNPFMSGYPRLNDPLSSEAVMPAEEVQCRRQLKRLGVRFRDIAPIRDSAACGIDWPVEVAGFSGSVGMKPAATLTCDMALAFAQWTEDELAPAARWRYFSGVKTIHQGSSYSCRSIAGSRTVSERAKGNALDVMRIELKNGKDIDVRKPGWFSFREKGLLNTVRSDACG